MLGGFSVSLEDGRNEETRCRKTPFAISPTAGHVHREPNTTTRGYVSTKLAAFHAVFPRFIYVFHYANGNGFVLSIHSPSPPPMSNPLTYTHHERTPGLVLSQVPLLSYYILQPVRLALIQLTHLFH